MNIYNLEIFCLCVEKGNFTDVANTLSISQPAVSLHIRNLEKYFGVPLFERFGKQFRLTDAGLSTYQYARDTLQALENLKNNLSDYNNGIIGSIKIGSSIILGRYQLPFVLANFKKEYENVDFRLIVDTRGAIAQMVLDGSVDFGYITSIGNFPGLIVEPVAWASQILIVSPDHPLAKKKVIEKMDLKHYPIVASLRENYYMRTLEERLREEGIDLDIKIQLGDIEGIKKGVQAGLGVGFITRVTIKNELELGLLKEVKVRDLNLVTRIDLIYRQGKYFTPLIQKLMNELRNNKF